jgi:hypothetical protein
MSARKSPVQSQSIQVKWESVDTRTCFAKGS